MSASHRSTVSLSDADIRGRLTPAQTIAVVREAVVGAHRGTFTAPPRVFEGDPGFGPVQSVGATSAWYGYVSSDSGSPSTSDSVVVLHDRESGEVRGMAVGSELARLCEAAVLGLAAELLAAPDAAVLAVIGDGRSVTDAIRAVAAVRPLDQVRISASLPGRTDNADLDADLGPDDAHLAASFAVPITRASSVAEAVAGASIVVLLRGTAEGLDPALLSRGCTVLVVGDPARSGEDFPADLVASVEVLVTDSPAQLAAYDGPRAPTAVLDSVVSLGSIADGTPARRRPTDRVGFLSVGLPAAEILLLDRLISS